MTLIRATALLPVLLLLANYSTSFYNKQTIGQGEPVVIVDVIPPVNSSELYNEWNLESAGLSKNAFIMAQKGYARLAAKHLLRNTNLLTIIDYSKPSTQKRLFVLDMSSGKILFNSLVAHGRNSGQNFARTFSNQQRSFKTSPGFYITGNTYNGGNGYSLRLKGCEKGVNDKAYSRAIVFHGADYVSEDFIRKNGYLGRSYGCPVVPKELNKKIIDVIKDGSCMFLYAPLKNYSSRSKILNS